MAGIGGRTSDAVVLEQLFGVVRRRWKVVGLFALLGLIAGLAYAEMQLPQYASSATVMVRSGPAADPLRKGADTSTPEEEGQFLSQLELARSSAVADLVITKLGLLEDAEFAKTGQSGVSRLVSWARRQAGLEQPAAPAALAKPDRVALLARLQAGVKVSRVGRTYVAAISYIHYDPATAQKIAQAFAEAFRDKLAEENNRLAARARTSVESDIASADEATRALLQQQAQDLVAATVVPGVDVLIISDAKKPGAPIEPRTSFLASVGLILGAALGCAIAGLREFADRGVRDGDLLARRLGVRFLGYLPLVKGLRAKDGMTLGRNATLPAAARYSVSDPFSAFGETIRTVAVALGAGKKDRSTLVSAVISALPGEGKTLLAANLAAHLANQGKGVLLIDVNVRNPALSNWLGKDAEMGVVDALLQGKSPEETILFDSRSNISLLPAALKDRVVEPSSLLTGEQINTLLSRLKGQYEHIIFDLASLSAAADARALEPLVDNFILAAEWGGAPIDLIADLLLNEPEVAAKTAGVVITATDLKSLPLYVAAGTRGSFQKRILAG